MFAAKGALYVRPSDDSRVGSEADSRLIREAEAGGVVLQDDGPPGLEARLWCFAWKAHGNLRREVVIAVAMPRTSRLRFVLWIEVVLSAAELR